MSAKQAASTYGWGALLLLTGLACLYVFGIQPVFDAQNDAPKVTLSFKALIVSPVLVILGGLMLLPIKPLPAPADPAAAAKAPLPLRAKLFFVLLIGSSAGAIGYYFWLRSYLRAHGYEF